MCGPSSGEKMVTAQQESLSNLLTANYAERFGEQSDVLKNLRNMYTPIAEAGPDQQGFGANELAALHTQAGQGVGVNYAKAKQALGNTLAARGGGNEFLPTGSRAALDSRLATSAANQISNEELGITRANYVQGRSNWQQATAGLHALSSEYNPTAFSGQAQSGFNSAFQMEDQISQEQNQKEAEIAGGITSLAMGAATFGAGAAGGGGFGGGLKALTGVHG